MSNSTLKSKIQSLILASSTALASSILEAVVACPLDEIAAARGGKVSSVSASTSSTKKSSKKSGRLARRSEEDIAKGVESIVKLVKSSPKGLRAEAIREELGLDVRELPRLLADAVASKLLTKTGNKRATTYFANGAAKGTTKVTKKTAKKGAKKATKAKAAKKTAPKKKASVKVKKAAAPKAKPVEAAPAEGTT